MGVGPLENLCWQLKRGLLKVGENDGYAGLRKLSVVVWVGDQAEVFVNFILLTFTKTMRLLNTLACKIQEFLPGSIPPYVILSHRWRKEEVSYKDLTGPKRNPSALKGWAKLESFCLAAKKDGWEWVWMDTCCIDKSNSTELSEAINSIYQWYREAEFCIAYLADVLVIKDETGTERKCLYKTEWFKRGWTL